MTLSFKGTKPKLIVITGPTASGKSALAVSLAKHIGAEIISADSRQVYKDIPIVTAIPSIEERQGITHHLLEILPLNSYYSAAKFKEDSENILKDLFDKNEYAIVCGGSMLYIDALVNGIDELPTVPVNIRETLTKEWKDNGDTWLLERLREIDPVYFERVDLKNLKRVFHAIEVSITAGKPYSSLLTKKDNLLQPENREYDILKICLNGDRDKLFEKINTRVLHMVEAGLEEEARKVYPLRELNSLNTVGLKEMFSMFDGKFTRDEAISRIQKNTRVYAKKQLTWHKRDSDMIYLNFQDSNESNIERILGLL